MVLSSLSLAAGFISCLLFACIMKNWSLVTCRTGYKRKKGEDVDINTEDKVAVFGWPEDEHLKDIWVRFVNRKDFDFDSKFVERIGQYLGRRYKM